MTDTPNVPLNLRSRTFLVMVGSAAFFAFMLVAGIRWGIPRAKGGLSLTSPAFFPSIVCWLGLTISVVSMIGAALVPRQETPPPAQPGYPLRVAIFRLAAVLALFAATYVLWARLGVLVTTVAVFAIMLVMGGERRPAVIATAAAGIPLAAHFIFRDLARVPLPSGILPF